MQKFVFIDRLTFLNFLSSMSIKGFRPSMLTFTKIYMITIKLPYVYMYHLLLNEGFFFFLVIECPYSIAYMAFNTLNRWFFILFFLIKKFKSCTNIKTHTALMNSCMNYWISNEKVFFTEKKEKIKCATTHNY